MSPDNVVHLARIAAQYEDPSQHIGERIVLRIQLRDAERRAAYWRRAAFMSIAASVAIFCMAALL